MKVSLLFRALIAVAALVAAAFYYISVEPPTTEVLKKWRIRADLSRPVSAGDELTRDIVEVQFLPVLASERATYTWAVDGDEAVLNALIGRKFVRDVQPGAFLEERFFFDDVVTDFSDRIDPDKRAFSVTASGAGSVDNFIAPGSRVDVVGLFVDRDGGVSPAVLLDNVEIMAVGPIADRDAFSRDDAGRYNSFTVQATREQFERFIVLRSQAEAELSIVLRSTGE